MCEDKCFAELGTLGGINWHLELAVLRIVFKIRPDRKSVYV